MKYLQYINGHHSSNTPTKHLAIDLQHISKKYPILSIFYRYRKRFKYHILAHISKSYMQIKRAKTVAEYLSSACRTATFSTIPRLH